MCLQSFILSFIFFFLNNRFLSKKAFFSKKTSGEFILLFLMTFILSLKIRCVWVSAPFLFEDWGKILFLPSIRLFLVTLLTGFVLYLIMSLVDFLLLLKNKGSDLSSTRKRPILSCVLGLFSFALLFSGFLLYFSSYWSKHYFGQETINQVITTITQPLEGVASTEIEGFIFSPLLDALALSLPAFYVIQSIGSFFCLTIKGKIVSLVLAISLCVISLYFAVDVYGWADVYDVFFVKSQIYEEYYVDASKVQITFPEKKRNLIYIYMESMENTYASKDVGGAQDENLIPNLTQFAQENISFSNNDLLGGAYVVSGVGFTVGSLIAQTMGLPFITALNQNDYANQSGALFPHVSSLGKTLKAQGYKNVFLLGSDAAYSSRDKYFKTHGNYEILDLIAAREKGWIPEDYTVWWGFEDSKLFAFGKEELTKLSQSEQPFNLTMLTVNTHHPGGYLEEGAPDLYGDQFSDVIHYSDEQVGEFVHWIQAQPFYENTTIVLVGDHTSMYAEWFTDLPKSYKRTVYNCILNADVQQEDIPEKNRKFSVLDMYPTTYAALGVKVSGEKLGLGVNLFSGEKTLIERLGFDTFNQELGRQSNIYNQLLRK